LLCGGNYRGKPRIICQDYEGLFGKQNASGNMQESDLNLPNSLKHW